MCVYIMCVCDSCMLSIYIITYPHLYIYIASCAEDRSVVIWKQTEIQGPWTYTVMKTFDYPVWRVSWSITGNVLAVSTGDHQVTLWKQTVDESWIQISHIDENSMVTN